MGRKYPRTNVFANVFADLLIDLAQIETMVKRLSAQQVISMIADDSDSISEDVSKH